MKKIIQIARLELSLLFYSPIAWLLLIVLFVQMSMMLMPSVAEPNGFANIGFLTSAVFTDSERLGLYQKILEHLYLYIPLITMGIMSKEISSGSIKLLLSSPIKLSDIVFGKFLSMMVYNFILVAVLAIFAVFASFYIPNFDYPLVLVALLAIYLLLNTYAAIGIFVSSLTSYQTVAAIATFVVLASMNYIGTLGQEYDIIRDLTHSLSMPARAERMIVGLLNTRDVIYYLTITGMFLAFTICKLKLARKPQSLFQQITRYATIVLISLAITYSSSRQALIGYYDATATKTNTISKVNQDILQRMGDGPLEITEYINGMDESYFKSDPKSRIADIARWEPYMRFKPDLKLKWVYYYDTIAGVGQYLKENNIGFNTFVTTMSNIQQIDISDFLHPKELAKEVDLSQEDKRFIMEVKYNGKTTFLRTFPPPDGTFFPGGAEIGAAFKRLIINPPKVVFATDGYARSIDKLGDRDVKNLVNNKPARFSLVNQGFDVDSLSLEHDVIPTDIAALVIADPRVAFTEAAKAKLQQFIDAGGNLMILGEPGKQEVINPLIASLGVEMMKGTIIQESRDFSYDLVTPKLAAGAVAMDKVLQPYFQHGSFVSMPNVGALRYSETSPYTIHPLLLTDPKVSWKKEGKFVLDSAAIAFEPENGDIREAFPTMLMLTRTAKDKEQRIIVASDADFYSNAELNRFNMATLNAAFASRLFGWFSYGEFPIDIVRPMSKDNTFTLQKEQVKTIQILFYAVMPGLMLLLASMVLIRRKQK